MAVKTSAETAIITNNETINSTIMSGKLHSMKVLRNIAKKFVQARIFLKLKKKIMNPFDMIPCHGFCSKKLIAPSISIPTAPIVSNYAYHQNLSCPLPVSQWNPMNTPIFTIQPLPIIIPAPSTIFATQACPFGGTIVQPVIAPIVSPVYVPGNVTDVPNYLSECNVSTEQIDAGTVNEQSFYTPEETTNEPVQSAILGSELEKEYILNVKTASDPIEVYLKLPKELFPTARMLAVDPNPIIDEFCKLPNLQRHAPWILDLEFGIPRTLITRPLPTYNVKFNSIHCKNTPDAIHPGFESCTPDFKRAMLFYYDCVISAWYRGFIMITSDRSVEHFQSWLLVPMQILGMCWP
uniref:Uncharacterized protein n=1 Tax=Heliothis virescens TaxID=7102 RepID=A0A2A4JBU0_HELVI